MKINEPITAEEHAAADEQHRKLALKQKAHAEKLAKALESGETLSSMDAKFAAQMIRRGAGRISTQRPRPVGSKTKVPDMARLSFAIMVLHEGISENEAINRLASDYDASETAIRNKLGKTSKAGWQDAKAATEEVMAFCKTWSVLKT